jgi:small-conductance mechanosensitive channel
MEIFSFLENLPPFWQWTLRFSALVAGSLIVGLLVRWLLFRVVSYYETRSDHYLLDSFVKYMRAPLGFFLPVLLFYLFLPLLPEADQQTTLDTLGKTAQVVAIISLGWVLSRGMDVLQDVVQANYSLDTENNLSARKVRTQTQYLKRVGNIIILVLVIAAILMSFERVRSVGSGLLASAGVAGILIGFAAQKSIANLLAGFQIAFTQPIRIDDVVIVENEWGKIEEITLTYVVVRIWDKRRLVLPITYFIEKPFQNWTRVSSDLLGAIYLYVDYTAPLAEMRAEYERLVKSNDLWDGEAFVMQVTDATERTMQVRMLATARNAPQAFDLRCMLREGMIDFLQKNYPAALPRTRSMVEAEFSGKATAVLANGEVDGQAAGE